MFNKVVPVSGIGTCAVGALCPGVGRSVHELAAIGVSGFASVQGAADAQRSQVRFIVRNDSLVNVIALWRLIARWVGWAMGARRHLRGFRVGVRLDVEWLLAWRGGVHALHGDLAGVWWRAAPALAG